MSDGPRYAIYYSPPSGHPLTRAAVQWLGRDAFRSRCSDIAPEVDLDAHPITTEARRYGFHATLKAPFRLAVGRTAEELEGALSRFAGSRRPCPVGPLRIDLISGFYALIPVHPLPSLYDFASTIVEAFDEFRAPLNEAELARRLGNRLDDVETLHLVRWGYPYVFDRFRFHMTLTDKLVPELRLKIRSRLEALFGTLATTACEIDALTLFEQAQPGADFVVRSQFTFKRDA